MNPFLFLREWWNLLTVRAIMCFAISFEPEIKVFRDSSSNKTFKYLELWSLACLGYLPWWEQCHQHRELALQSLKVTIFICARKQILSTPNKAILTILPLVPFWMSVEAKQVKYLNTNIQWTQEKKKREYKVKQIVISRFKKYSRKYK